MASNDKGHSGGHTHHAIPQTTLIAVFVILVLLMVSTIAASYLTLPTIWMNVIALVIATVKASLVVTIFMGVGYSTKLVKLYALGGFAWFFLLFIMLADYTTRPTEPVVGWETDPASALPRGTTERPD